MVIDLQCGLFHLSLREKPLDRISEKRDAEHLSSMVSCP